MPSNFRCTRAFGNILVILCFIFIFVRSGDARADLADDLRIKIDERNNIIEDLEREIAEYQAEVEKTSAQAKSLKNSIAALELTRKRLSAEISSIENKISLANLSIKQLDVEISDAEKAIERELAAISSIISETEEQESTSLVETLLSYQSLSIFFDRVDSLSQLNIGLVAKLKSVRTLKKGIEDKKFTVQGKRQELVSLATSLTDKKKVAEYNKAQTNKILTQTKNQEANYRKLLKEKQALRDAFARELLEYESQLKFVIDPDSLPEPKAGVLNWPLESHKITQPFGDTEFSRANPRVYNGRGHNGIDLKAAVGTAVKAALSGKVVGVGDTDAVCSGASYGKWVFIEHENGLSTLYAHLSVIKVTLGQNVSSGELIGYSGETGYATGPHLHFTVYATQGVKILSRQSKVCNAQYTMPVGSLNAYLNPMLYL